MTIKELFDLVAPIAICGGTDCMYEAKAIAAWAKIRLMDKSVWSTPPPIEIRSIADSDDFDFVFHKFAMDEYNSLFEQIVAECGPAGLESGYDYWGARGFKFPNQSYKNFPLVGDNNGNYPWYETADLLIAKLKTIHPQEFTTPDPE